MSTRRAFFLSEVRSSLLQNNWIELTDVWNDGVQFVTTPDVTTSNTGYFGGGYPDLSTMDKVTYSTDTTAYTPGANLSLGRYDLAATGNSTAGYFGGGFYPGYITETMDKVTYSTDTTAYTPGANLSSARYGFAAASAKANALPEIPVPGFVQVIV